MNRQERVSEERTKWFTSCLTAPTPEGVQQMKAKVMVAVALLALVIAAATPAQAGSISKLMRVKGEAAYTCVVGLTHAELDALVVAGTLPEFKKIPKLLRQVLESLQRALLRGVVKLKRFDAGYGVVARIKIAFEPNPLTGEVVMI